MAEDPIAALRALREKLRQACGMLKLLDFNSEHPSVTQFLAQAEAVLASSPSQPAEQEDDPIPRVDLPSHAPTPGSTAQPASGDAPTLREHDWFGRVCKTCGTTSDRPDASGACRSDTE